MTISSFKETKWKGREGAAGEGGGNGRERRRGESILLNNIEKKKFVFLN